MYQHDVSTPSAPQEAGYLTFAPLPGHNMTSLEVWPGPGNYVFVGLMSYGVGIIDATDASTFSQGFALGSPFKLPGIANGIAAAPVIDGELYPARSAVYVADGRGGVHHVRFNVFDTP